MSDLKHRSLVRLYEDKEDCEEFIITLKSRLNGQQSRLEWIKKYIFENTPIEMSMDEIERRLGHKVIIK